VKRDIALRTNFMFHNQLRFPRAPSFFTSEFHIFTLTDDWAMFRPSLFPKFPTNPLTRYFHSRLSNPPTPLRPLPFGFLPQDDTEKRESIPKQLHISTPHSPSNWTPHSSAPLLTRFIPHPAIPYPFDIFSVRKATEWQ
jgi:hypothetical protein